MGLLSAPRTDYTNFYDQARYNLVWYISLVFAAFILILTAVNFSNESYKPTPYLSAFLMAAVSIIVLRITRKYEVMSMVIAVGSLAITSYTFLAHDHVIQYTTPMWVVINIIFTYFTLGRRWGTVVLLLQFVVIGIFFYTKFQNNLSALPVYDDLDIHYFVLEYAFACAFMGYFLHMFVTTTYYAERKYKVSNTRLNTHNAVITKQNEEKEVMLKEIHHRVKNNLQVVTSLLRLQSYEVENGESVEKFNEAISRVKAMALIHEKMYQKEMLESFDLENYIQSLSADLLTTYNLSQEVEFKVESNVEKVGSRTIVPLALLFNELITNALKHAFEGIENPRITIVLLDQSDRNFEMIFADNGSWKEGDGASFGQELITTMTEQLDGEYELTKGAEGTRYHFRLKNLHEHFDEGK